MDETFILLYEEADAIHVNLVLCRTLCRRSGTAVMSTNGLYDFFSCCEFNTFKKQLDSPRLSHGVHPSIGTISLMVGMGASLYH